MNSARAHVRDNPAQTFRDLLLDIEIPLHDVVSFRIGLNIGGAKSFQSKQRFRSFIERSGGKFFASYRAELSKGRGGRGG